MRSQSHASIVNFNEDDEEEYDDEKDDIEVEDFEPSALIFEFEFDLFLFSIVPPDADVVGAFIEDEEEGDEVEDICDIDRGNR